MAKLIEKKQSAPQRKEAGRALDLLLARRVAAEPTTQRGQQAQARGRWEAGAAREQMPPQPAAKGGGKGAPHGAKVARQRGEETSRPTGGASWERQYEELQGAVKMHGYSPRTLDAYRIWIRKFQSFVRSKPPEELAPKDVKAFLTRLAVKEKVASSTQNQAFNALLFFYRHVLRREFGKVDGVVRAKRRPYIPVVLSRREVDQVLAQLQPPYRLVAALLYGCGLRISECLELRVHCFNLEAMLVTVHDGKGKKDRTVPLPAKLMPEMERQLEEVRSRHQKDLAAGYSGVFLPAQLERKYRNAAKSFLWQWFFPG